MKKLLFIIPRVKIIIVFSFLFFNVVVLHAVDVHGCNVLAGSTQRVYLNEIAPYDHTKFTGTLISGLGGYTDQSGSECIDNIGPPCTVYYGDGGTGTTTTIYKIGSYARLYDNCPIDDYIPAILTFIASIGFLQIRKIPIFNSENENIDHQSSL